MAPRPNQPDDYARRPRNLAPNAVPYTGSHMRTPSRGNDLGLLNNSNIHAQFQADSSSSDDDLQPAPSRRPGHNRSMSHPFPSLFSSKKKRRPSRSGPGDSDSDSAGHGPGMSRAGGKPQPPGPRHGASGSKDFATGACMTCGSLVRWPRELKVFKCTICVTVNDLEPIPDTPRAAADARPPHDGGERSPPAPLPTSNSNSISLEHTRSLVKQCLRSFLQTSLTDPPPPTTPLFPRHSRASSAASMGGLASDNTPPMSRSPQKTQPWIPGAAAPAIRVSTFPTDRLGNHTVPAGPMRLDVPKSRSYSTSFPDGRPDARGLGPAGNGHQIPRKSLPPPQDIEPRRIFKQLEDYLISCFSSFHAVNTSFLTPGSGPRPVMGTRRRRVSEARREAQRDEHLLEPELANLDPKLLLLGDFAENGSWWTGRREEVLPVRSSSHRSDGYSSLVSHRSPRINWTQLDDWYSTVINAGESWVSLYEEMVESKTVKAPSEPKLQHIESRILQAQEHTQRVLLKATEMLLKRPGRPICETENLRFLLITLANPLLHASCTPYKGHFEHPELARGSAAADGHETARGSGPVSGKHSVIIKRVLGLLSNSKNECQSQLISWFARFPPSKFLQVKDLVGGFLAYRLIRQNEKKQEVTVDITGGLIPNMSAGRSPASLYAAIGATPGSAKKPNERPKTVSHNEDWQIKAAARVLSLLFVANNSEHARRGSACLAPENEEDLGPVLKDRLRARGQIVPTSDFYTALLDDSDLVADFETWESKRGKFSFCQYPFLLSIWAKIQILEHDARRQMRNKARDAFFDSILTNRSVNQLLILNVRRDCLVEDSLRAVSEVVGSGGEDIKKGLKIVFRGEEGVDAGGLRKEWFLLLVREVFNPDHGMFVYDEESNYCYFNPNAFETSDQFFLVGVVFGLAIYNSTILDVAFPPFAFRKLLAAAPAPAGVVSGHQRSSGASTLDDLAEYHPRLAKSLRQLLDFEGDVESTFSLDFVVEVDKYGSRDQVPLCPGGERRPVTNENRREYVDLYVRYLLDTAVSRQFEPFKRGFFTVCGGNALSLFRPEEIELLVRGSEEPLDIDSLRMAADYTNWGDGGRARNPAESEETIQWFWQSFEQASPQDQRKLLLFITGSDRIPAMGAASLTIRVSCLGDDCGRYPTARTCFNTLALWRCTSRERLESMLWRAVHESEGFGLK